MEGYLDKGEESECDLHEGDEIQVELLKKKLGTLFKGSQLQVQCEGNVITTISTQVVHNLCRPFHSLQGC